MTGESIEFMCAACGKSFTSMRQDDEARAEAEKIFGEHVWAEVVSIICDRCWKQIMAM